MTKGRQTARHWLVALCVIGATIGALALGLYLIDATPIDPSELPETTALIPSIHWVGAGSKGIAAVVTAAFGLPFAVRLVRSWWRRR